MHLPTCDPRGYRVIEIKDQGGYGIVSIVEKNTAPGNLYARKQLSKARVQQEQLEKEVSLILEARHRHVVTLVDTYEDDFWSYIVTLPAADCNLEKYFRDVYAQRPTDAESWASFGHKRLQLFRWIHCLTITIQELHSRNIRHRDIKPQNILIKGTGILLTDFGISFSVDGLTKIALTTNIGTERYEPSQALPDAGDSMNKKFRTGRSGDVFSLGCVIFEMLDALSRPVS